MKKLLTISLSILSLTIMAQVPQGVGYQGVATDANGIELVNQAISIRAIVLSGSANGTIEWEESHATTTDTFGLFTLTIGQGTNTTNGLQTSFADISWGTNTYFLKIEMDVTGGSTYSNMGTNQMMSVPYALYAENTNINYDSIATILSNDSSFTNSLGGSGSGGCNMKFPEGVNGEVIHEEITKFISYTVPSGKRLYITNWFSSSSYGYKINGDMKGYLPDVHPLKLNPGDVISCELVPANSGNQTILFTGLLIDVNPDVLVIHEEITKFIYYTVPSGKRLYITNWFSSSSYGYKINGDVKGYLPSFHTIKLNPGDVISCELVPTNSGNQTILFSGYLVDENYFAGCGGGGSSSASAVDSAMVAGMIANAGGSGGCDFKYPEGIDGEVLTINVPFNGTYTVPSGKRFYIHQKQSSPSSNDNLSINGIDINNYDADLNLVIANPGDVLGANGGLSGVVNLNILSVNSTTNIEALTLIVPASGYTVPSGKRFYIHHKFSALGNRELKINSISINYYDSNLKLVIANPGDVLERGSSHSVSLNGYLVDENYFAGCGGGGSSGASSGLDSATVASMIASAISNSVSIGIGDYYAGGIVGYIFQPGDADYILGETHGYILYFDETGIEWGCNGVTTNVVNNTIGQGPNNTQTLLNLCPESNFAAKWCNDLVVGPYNDWFLPTYEEAILIDLSFYLNLTNSSSYIQFWLSEEFAPNPNPYNYNCPSCSSASHAWVMYNSSGTLEANARLKINNQAGNIIAFRKF